jgi:hypothetical protein
MHRTAITLFGLGTLAAALSCGAPAELDESQFPELAATGYTDGEGSGGASAVLPPGGASANGAGSGTSLAGGMTGASAMGGGANVPSGTGGVAMPNGASGTSGTSGGAPSAGSGGGCPDDITVLFNRPIQQGGCAGGGCHVPGDTRPDLVSPNPEERLLNVQSQCMGMPYIGASVEDSLLAAKITTPPDGCGLAMPFFMPQALSAEDEACILEWVTEISGG